MSIRTMIYLDHHATTPVDERVLNAMLPFFRDKAANAASRNHRPGREAASAVDDARQAVAALIGAEPRAMAFTSGATESNNLALKGVVEGARLTRDAIHIITQRTEHKAVLDSARHLERHGVRVSYLDVMEDGRVDPEQVSAAIEDDPVLVSVMWTNNETGAHSALRTIGTITSARGVLLHIDASQGLGYLPLDVDEVQADLVSLTAHKIYGPKGIGALYARRRNPRVRLVAQMDGGGQEHGLRGGTLNVPAIVGFGRAAAILRSEADAERVRIAALRDRLWDALKEHGALLNGPSLDGWRHPGNLNVSFEGIDSAQLLVRLSKELAISSGSACSTGKSEPSHVLMAMCLGSARAASSLRFGVGRETTRAEIDRAATLVIDTVQEARIENENAPDHW